MQSLNLWGYEVDTDCLSCDEPCDPERDEVVQGPDKKPIGYAHQDCIDAEVEW